eukprot:TRINITY_DN9135_c0_g1_i1.p1 TRINITY_DN9135_c0_g1~~TRINITY_DN9135_c0_g1_i1.p1  ORF type:complete len:221 (+),score=34.98 TRINITY_DN9135_c0_g1_i1:104-766(+)
MSGDFCRKRSRVLYIQSKKEGRERMSSWFNFSWFRGVLGYLGLINLEAKMVFVGLDNAGKSTLLGQLAHGRLTSFKPTESVQTEELQLGKLQFNTHDLGGHKAARKQWKKFFVDADVIVFLVDAADPTRFPEAKQELDSLLKDTSIKYVPFLILGNKVDLPEAVSESELRQHLGLQYTTQKGNVKLEPHTRPMEVFMCSAARNAGYAEGFRWVSQYVQGK